MNDVITIVQFSHKSADHRPPRPNDAAINWVVGQHDRYRGSGLPRDHFVFQTDCGRLRTAQKSPVVAPGKKHVIPRTETFWVMFGAAL